MTCILAMAQAAAPQHDPAQIERDRQELRQHRLSMPTVRQMFAVNLASAKEMKKDPSLKSVFANGGSMSISDLERLIDREPRIGAKVKAAGLTSREYALTMLSLFPAMTAYAMQKAGGPPHPILKMVSPEHLKFVSENSAELEKMQAELAAYEQK